MKVKRYVVDTLPDALSKIRQELGKDAVILNTKQLRVGGILGMFGKKKIEVIAAVDSTAAVADKLPQQALATTAAAAIADKLPQQTPAVTAAEAAASPEKAAQPVVGSSFAAQAYRNSTSPSTQSEPRQAAARPKPQEPAQPVLTEALADADSGRDLAVEQFKRAAAKSIQDAAARQAGGQQEAEKPSVSNNGGVDQQELLTEIKEMKALVAKLSGGAQTSEAPESPAVDAFHVYEQRLIHEQGITPAVATELKRRALESGGMEAGHIDAATARKLLREQLLRMFRDAPASGIADSSRILQFVGPTGVGKTTTIAKLAAEQVLKHNKKVGFITSDTYRIAAIDQLKTYATILNVPVEVVFTPEELPGALEKLSDRSLIFMDTAGRNYRDEASVAELNGLLSEHGHSETYLVLSMVSKYNDIKAIVENFKSFKLDKVIWTKMDETVSYGSVVNLLHDYALPLSYITNGQNVPDDFSLLQPEIIVEHLLGEDAYE